MLDHTFWKKRRVFVTGHTGFKGSWLCLWLHALGAEVTGYSLNPPTEPNLFGLCRIDRIVRTVTADVRDLGVLRREMSAASPELVLHMAAQPLVRESYGIPAETYDVNVMGTVNVLESVRNSADVKAVINVTTDKCYENREWVWGYRENEALGGYDPYSSSKACSELVTSAYRNSYFNPGDHASHGVGIATARAGNVIGGGDWGGDRLVPDCIRALLKGERVSIRNPTAIRPWQYVLEPLFGYLVLAQKLFEDGSHYAGAWNFGPDSDDAKPVLWLIERICAKWGDGASYMIDSGKHPHEAHYLKLDCSKAKSELGWRPRWSLDKAIDKLVAWMRTYAEGRDVKSCCMKQIEDYMQDEGTS